MKRSENHGLPDHVKTRDLEGLVREVARRRISRRQFLERALCMGLTATAAGSVLAACGEEGEGGGGSASPAAMDTTLPDKFYLYNWEDYLTDGIKKGFQKKYGIEVVETYLEDNEAVLAKFKAGARGYDMTVVCDYMVSIMIKTGLLVPLDMSYIPNFKNVHPNWEKPEYDPETDGKKYSVPYQWGTTGVGVRTDVITEPVDSWANLWDPKYKNNIVMLNDERESPGAALALLGYSMNSTNLDELEQAKQKLFEQKPLVKAYTSVATRRMIVQGTGLVHGWTGYVLSAWDAMGRKNLTYMLPKEGYCLWTDNAVIPVGGPSPYAAHLFIDYILQPEVAGELVDYSWFHSPVPAAKEYSDPIVWEFAPSDTDMERGVVFEDLAEFQPNYTQLWQEVQQA